MKTITPDYKEQIKKMGRQFDVRISYIGEPYQDGSVIVYSEIVLTKEHINSISVHYEGTLLKSVMKQLDIDSNQEIPLEKELTFRFGILQTDNSYHYINYGKFIVNKVEKQEDTNSWKITCYDKMLYAMKPYEQLVSKNLFDGDYAKAYIGGASGYQFVMGNASAEIARTAIIEVEPNTTYTIKKYNDTGLGNRFVIAEYPTLLTETTEMGNSSRLFSNHSSTQATVTTTSNGNYLYVYVTNDSTNTPILQIEKGNQATSYSPFFKYPITMKNYLKILSENIGLELQDSNFANYNKEITSELYLDASGNSIGYTYRDVLDEIAGATGSAICIDKNDKLEVRYINQTVGKNLLNPARIMTRTKNGITSSYNKETQVITFNGTCTSNNTTFQFNGVNQDIHSVTSGLTRLTTYYVDGTISGYFYVRLNNDGWSKQNSSNLENIVSEGKIVLIVNQTYDLAENGLSFRFDNGSVANNIKIKLMIANSSDTTYEPYGDTINEEYLKDVNVNFGEKYGPINSVVLSRSGESDNIYEKDDDSIEENGLTEIKIKDNQILNGNNRDEFLPAIFDKLNGIEYYINDYSSTGITYYDLLDRYNVKIGDNFYSCVMFNDEINITQGIEENVFTEMPEQTETEYQYANKTDRTINQAYIIAKKNDAEIEALASKVVDISNTISGTGSITLENAYEGILHRLEITGSIGSLLPSTSLTPKTNLTPIAIYIVVDETEYLLDIDYLNYTNATNHDTFVYEDGKCWIERANGTIEEREPVTILVDKNSEISIEPFTDAHLFCEYLLDNKYTSTFANQVEVSSELNLLADTIEAKVSQVADEDGNVTSASIILAVNNDEGQATIQADKINLNGLVTANENFKILEDGSMEANNGVFKGEINGGKISITGNFTEQDPYIRLEHPESSGSTPIATDIWTNGISCYDYAGGLPVIRTETADGFAELSGSVVNAYGFNNVSLEERKKNFDKLENALKLISEIDIYKYNYKEENDDDKKHIGVVIGKDYKYSKEITSKNNEEIDIYSFVSVCCKAIQELQQEIEELRKEIK